MKTNEKAMNHLTSPSSPHRLCWRMGFLLVLLLAIHQAAQAQANSNLVNWVIAGGGNGNCTIGQWNVGTLASERDLATPTYQGGFWDGKGGLGNGVEVPLLRVQRIGGSLLIAWPASLSGFQLEQSSALGADGVWESVSLTVNVADGENQITFPIGPGTQFFRLRKP